VNIPQSTYRGRVEIGGMYLLSQLERIPSTTLYVMVDIMKAGGRAPPTLRSKAREMTLHGCPPGRLKESDPAG
jgi:hypothetical protein